MAVGGVGGGGGRLVKLLNSELSLKRCWRGLRSQEVGEEGDSIPNATLSPPERLLHSDGQR